MVFISALAHRVNAIFISAYTYTVDGIFISARRRLQEMFGNDAVNERTIVAYKRTRWKNDPFTRGSYGHVGLGESSFNPENRRCPNTGSMLGQHC